MITRILYVLLGLTIGATIMLRVCTTIVEDSSIKSWTAAKDLAQNSAVLGCIMASEKLKGIKRLKACIAIGISTRSDLDHLTFRHIGH